MPKKKKSKTTEVEEHVPEDDDAPLPLPPAPKKKAGVEVGVYFAVKGTRKGHKPGMVAYAEQKLGKTTRRLKLTLEEWAEIFSTY